MSNITSLSIHDLSNYFVCTAPTLSVRPASFSNPSPSHNTLMNLSYTDNPVNHFPVYEPSADRVAQIEAEFAEENNPLNIHYDASHEVRAKGAGFYQFSGDEETRRRQMEELREARKETVKVREEMGAEDVGLGEEGMVRSVHGGEGKDGLVGGAGSVRSRAMEKRKRELEERRKLVEAKRRKVNAGGKESDKGGDETQTLVAQDDEITTGPDSRVPSDPFAVLEAETSRGKGKGKAKEHTAVATPMDAADAFLAQIEQDVLKGMR